VQRVLDQEVQPLALHRATLPTIDPTHLQVEVNAYTNHRVTSISVNGTVLLSGVTYDPFGPVTGWTWGNGTSVSRTYDEDGYTTVITTAADTISYGFDSASRITSISDPANTSNSWTLGYDLLDRLTAANDGTSYGWTYDANGNRLTQTGSGDSTSSVSSTSNRLNSTSGSLVRSYAYDAGGNITGSGVSTFAYNQRGRMVTDTTGSTVGTHVYNAMGQMIQNKFSTINTELMFDEAGHLLGEYSPTNGALQS
jgi:YD repeat-containing protein